MWSCCFNDEQPHYVFAATQNGQVQMFDSRMTHHHQQRSTVGDGGGDYSGYGAGENSRPVSIVCDLRKPIFGLKWISGMPWLEKVFLDKPFESVIYQYY